MRKERRRSVEFQPLTSYEGHGKGETYKDLAPLFHAPDNTGLFTLAGVMLFVRFLIDVSRQTVANEFQVFPATLVSISVDEIENRAAKGSLSDEDSKVLHSIGQQLSRITRQADKAGRHGTRFIVLLTRTMAYQVREFYGPRTSDLLQDAAKEEGMTTTFSFGVASLTEHSIRDTDDMFRKSAKALEVARQQGPGSLVLYDFRTMPLDGDK